MAICKLFRIFIRVHPRKFDQPVFSNFTSRNFCFYTSKFSSSSSRSSSQDPPTDNNQNKPTDNVDGISSSSAYVSKRIEKRLEKAKETLLSNNSNEHPKEIIEDFIKNDRAFPSQDIPEVEFPSDSEKYLNWYRNQERKAYRTKTDPESTSIFLFPGQGSQYVGMGKALLDYPNVMEMFEIANDILGYDLLKLCLNGPQKELDKTRVCQPAILVTSLAAVEKLRVNNLPAIENCISTAGFSIGEFAALVFAGVISFEDALSLVKVRAEVMQAASEAISSGMMSVFLNHNTKLRLALEVSREVCRQKHGIVEPICHVANYLYPDCKVIAGHHQALKFIEENAKDFGIKRTKRLPVSGAFHTTLMQDGLEDFSKALKKVEFQPPTVPVFSNVKAERYSDSQQDFVKLLRMHLIKPVKWEQTMHVLYSRKQGTAFPHTYELGPGKQLGTLLRMVNLKAFNNYHKIEV